MFLRRSESIGVLQAAQLLNIKSELPIIDAARWLIGLPAKWAAHRAREFQSNTVALPMLLFGVEIYPTLEWNPECCSAQWLDADRRCNLLRWRNVEGSKLHVLE